ncbi:MAG: OFA family MFS transporter [Sarcina sp.]|nr:OFA family MFS transporter [Sarcina sp.]
MKQKRANRSIYPVIGVLIMLMAGTVYTWTIIAKSISATFPDWTAQTLSMTFTITMMGYAVGGMVSGMLLRRTGPRIILAGAAVLFPGGMLLASAAQTPFLLYIGFGAMSGIAAGLCYNSTVSTVSAWFPDRQGVVSGILVAGFGLSSFIAGKLFAAFAPADGTRLWAAGLRVLAVLILAVLAAGIAVMRFPRAEELPAAEPGPAGGRRKKTREPACDIPTGEMVRRSSFWLFYAWAALLTGCGLLLVSQAGGIAGEAGPALSGGTIATAVGMISILNAAGRVCTGTVYDRFGYRVTMLMDMISFGAGAALMLAAVRAGNFPLLIAGFLAGGFAYGGVASISPPLIADFYGRTWYAANFSLIPTNALFTSFASVLAGRIYDNTHSYQGSLILLLAAIALSFLLSFAIRRPALTDRSSTGQKRPS